jgi:amidohydrolase
MYKHIQKGVIDAMDGWLREVRRDLHMHPEMANKEFRTSGKIKEYLDEFGIEYKSCGKSTGIVGLIRGAYPGKTVAIRADMDALPITEQNEVPYKSQNEGVMHACGHDAHTTILLGTAKYFASVRNQLHGNIKLIFQPAEESLGGAQSMIEAGCLTNPEVDCVIGLHVIPSVPCGMVEAKYGAMYAARDTVNITINGCSTHGAHPDTGVDAIVATAQVINALQTVVSRNVAPTDSVVFSIGAINGGTASNIICDKVSMKCTLRTIKESTRALVHKRITEIVQGVSASMGCSAELEIIEGYPLLVNHDEAVDTIIDTASDLLGEDKVIRKDSATLGAEDFSFFLKSCKGAYYHLGCGNKEKGITASIHNNRFDIDEDCLKLGVMLHASIAYRLLEN